MVHTEGEKQSTYVVQLARGQQEATTTTTTTINLCGHTGDMNIALAKNNMQAAGETTTKTTINLVQQALCRQGPQSVQTSAAVGTAAYLHVLVPGTSTSTWYAIRTESNAVPRKLFL